MPKSGEFWCACQSYSLLPSCYLLAQPKLITASLTLFTFAMHGLAGGIWCESHATYHINLYVHFAQIAKLFAPQSAGEQFAFAIKPRKFTIRPKKCVQLGSQQRIAPRTYFKLPPTISLISGIGLQITVAALSISMLSMYFHSQKFTRFQRNFLRKHTQRKLAPIMNDGAFSCQSYRHKLCLA